MTTASNHRFFLSVWMLLGVLLFFLGLWAIYDSDDSTSNTLAIVSMIVGTVLALSSLWMRLQVDRTSSGRGQDLAP